MLRGQVALHQGQSGVAVEHLEQAVRLLPESVAARAMLCLAVSYDGRWDQSILMLEAVDTLTPRTAEDYLFLGWARSDIADSSSGLAALDEAVRLRPGSPMARVVRADMRAWSALDHTDMELMEDALTDARTAKGMLPESFAAIAAHLNAHLVALNLYEEQRNGAKRQESLAVLEMDAKQLGRFKGLSSAHSRRAAYFEHVGRYREALNEWREAATGAFSSDGALRSYAFALYRNGDFDGALKAADRLCESAESGNDELTRALILMFIGRPDARERALEAYERAMGDDKSSIIRLWLQVIPELVGRPELVQGACPDIATKIENLPSVARDWYQELLDYVCGKTTVEEAMALSEGSRFRRCELYFLLGVSSLAEGDRAQARKHFQSNIDTRVFYFWDWEWSRMFLEKLQRDPTWPPWIPMRDDNGAKNTTEPHAVNGSEE